MFRVKRRLSCLIEGAKDKIKHKKDLVASQLKDSERTSQRERRAYWKKKLAPKIIGEKHTMMNVVQKDSRYIFTEIPNNEYGKKLTRGMKVYLNDESYTMRVRGQHIKPELRGTGATYWGQSIEQSTHLECT